MTDVEYPPIEHLTFWWTCQRKWSFPTEAEAVAHRANYPTVSVVSYHCKYGDHWHLGRPRGAASKFGPSMLRKQWRRRIKKPTLKELQAAYEKAVST